MGFVERNADVDGKNVARINGTVKQHWIFFFWFLPSFRGFSSFLQKSESSNDNLVGRLQYRYSSCPVYDGCESMTLDMQVRTVLAPVCCDV